MVRVSIRPLTGPSSSITLEVDPSTTISELKDLVAEAYQTSSENVRLIFRTTTLIDSETIASSNITDDTIVHAHIHPSRSSPSNPPSLPAADSSLSVGEPPLFPPEPPLFPPEPPLFPPEPPLFPPEPPFSPDDHSSPSTSTSTSRVLDLDDPSIPDWVRDPAEISANHITPADIQRLVELGFTVRQARNALRLAEGDLESAASHTEYLMTEEDNRSCERVYLAGSGLSPTERLAEYGRWMRRSQPRQRNEHPSYSRDRGSLIGRLLGLPERTPPRVEPVISVTPEDVAPFLSGNDLDLEARLHEKFDANCAKALSETLELLRNGIADTTPEFVNPFALLGAIGTVGNQIFGDNLELAARLNTEECQWLLTKWRDGTSFDDLCQVLEAAESNLDTAEQLLSD